MGQCNVVIMSVMSNVIETRRTARGDVDDEAIMVPDDDERGDRFRPGRITALWLHTSWNDEWTFLTVRVIGHQCNHDGTPRFVGKHPSTADIRSCVWDEVSLPYAPEWVQQFVRESSP